MKHVTVFIFSTLLISMIAITATGQNNRAVDGYGNNVFHPEWGSAGINQLQSVSIGFSDKISEPAGADRPNPRHISNMLFVQLTLANDPLELSAYCWGFGQFIDHDITLVRDNHNESLTIPIPPGDVYFDPAGTGNVTIPLFRSSHDPITGTDTLNPRQFINSITAFIDGSVVYGSSEERASWLRTFSDGKLRTSSGDLLPWNTTTGQFDAPVDPNAPQMDMPLPFVQKWFVAGDARANENPFLTSFHTLFVREHNRLCDELKTKHPGWSDERIYQHARRLVSGQLQAIVYEEWLPAMGMAVPDYEGYDPNRNPGIMNVFSAAAYRYGHTTINSLLVRMDNNGDYIPEGDVLLRDAFFNPAAITDISGIEPYLIGMATVVQQDFDCKMVDDLRNFLFGQPGAGGLDLAAINILRGRERGLPDYNTVRKDFGLSPATSFADISNDPQIHQRLELVYDEVDEVDPWVGMLAENHMPSALFGETAMTIVKEQFMALRDGDRYYYENDPLISEQEIQWIKETHLADVIRRNTPADIIQDDIFFAQSIVSSIAGGRNEEEIAFTLYPNPVRNMVFLRIPATGREEAIITITDMQGKQVLSREAKLFDGNNTVTLTLPASTVSGVYVLSIQSDERYGSLQFIKQ